MCKIVAIRDIPQSGGGSAVKKYTMFNCEVNGGLHVVNTYTLTNAYRRFSVLHINDYKVISFDMGDIVLIQSKGANNGRTGTVSDYNYVESKDILLYRVEVEIKNKIKTFYLDEACLTIVKPKLKFPLVLENI